MKKKSLKKRYVILIALYTLLVVLASFFAQSKLAEVENIEFESSAFYAKGVVQEVVAEQVEVLIKSGPGKGDTRQVEHHIDGTIYDIEVSEGDKVLLYASQAPEEEGYSYYISDYYHLDALIWILVIFIVVAIILGGKYGLKALFSLGLSLMAIFGVLIPLVKAGYDPVLVTIIIGIFTAMFVIHIIQGFNRYSLVAFIGTVGGLIFAGLIAMLTAKVANLTGLSTEDSRLLSIYWPDLKFQGLLLSGIMIGALGALMDVAVSISAALIELKKHKPKITSVELFVSGINVGKNIMGSMINTLVFAYV